MFDMLGKLNEMKKKMEEIKSRLDNISVDGNGGDGAVKIEMTANRKVKNVFIEDSLLDSSRKEELTDYLEIAMNDALEKAQNISETEMEAAGKGILPNIPGLF